MFKYSLDNKRYHTLNYEMQKKFNERVFKASLNGGFPALTLKIIKDVYFVHPLDQEILQAIKMMI